MARIDGRSNEQLRKVQISRDYISYAEGSCLIELGKTRVICTASVEEGVPLFLKGSGTGWVTAEYGMLPRSCQTRVQRGKDSGRTVEIQRLVGRSLRTVTDMKCMGERTVWIDCDVIQADGGTRTAAITGSFIALVDALHSMKKSGVCTRMPIKDYVAATSVGIVKGEVMLDLCYEEDSKAEVDMNVIMTGSGRFIEVQGTAERAPFAKEQLDTMLAAARGGIAELCSIQRTFVGAFLQ